MYMFADALAHRAIIAPTDAARDYVAKIVRRSEDVDPYLIVEKLGADGF